jgi:hypothetical protein
MSSPISPETMFLLSLPSQQREFLTDTVEEAVRMRSEGLIDEDIAERLSEAIERLEGWTSTPEIIRRIVLGIYDAETA